LILRLILNSLSKREEEKALDEKESLKKLLRSLFETQRLGVLATQRDEEPYTSLVAFAATDDLKGLVFATTRATRKYANLSANSSVAILIDNRSNEVSDFRSATATTAIGHACEVVEPERDELLRVYLSKHPHLREFVEAPSCALLKINVKTYYVVNRFQHVMVLHVNP
jgi:nitroimidazol reductase NimA-like FMN-containing flavoprotein (pyridoxamine 5'-phosphate oxidase superfamily)